MVVLRQNLQASPPVEKLIISQRRKIKMMLKILPGRDDVSRRPGTQTKPGRTDRAAKLSPTSVWLLLSLTFDWTFPTFGNASYTFHSSLEYHFGMTKVLENTIFELKQNRTSENVANFEAEGEDLNWLFRNFYETQIFFLIPRI